MTEILCNNCKNPVKYIETRKRGTVKCNPIPIEAYQESGRVVEVYLKHECQDNNGSSSEVPTEKNEERKLWTGPAAPQ